MFRSGKFTLFLFVVVFLAHESKFSFVVGRASKVGRVEEAVPKIVTIFRAECIKGVCK